MNPTILFKDGYLRTQNRHPDRRLIQLELNIAFLSTGLIVVAYTLWRTRRITEYKETMNMIQDEYDVESLDHSGETKYTQCKSHEWVIDNMVRKKHGRFGDWFQNQLHDNTLGAAMWVGLFMGMAAIILGLVLVRSIEIIGMAVFVFLVGSLIIIGPGGPKLSEELLQAIKSYSLNDLCEEDFIYVKISYDSIKGWLITSGILGIGIIIISPWAENIPIALALSISIFSEYILWAPALLLAEIWFPLSIIYLAGVMPILILILITIVRRIKGVESDKDTGAYQW